MSSIHEIRVLKDIIEVKKIAKALRIHEKVGCKHKKEAVLKAEIINTVQDSGTLLYHDWLKRIRSGRNPWKQYYDPLRKYSQKQLEDIAKKYAIPIYHKSIKQLRIDISEYQRNQQPLEEKYEQEEKSQPIQQYNPVFFPYNAKWRQAHISFNYLPVNAETITNAINSAIHLNNEQLGVNIDMEEYDRYVTMNGTMSVSSYYKKSKNLC